MKADIFKFFRELFLFAFFYYMFHLTTLSAAQTILRLIKKNEQWNAKYMEGKMQCSDTVLSQHLSEQI